MNIVKIFQKEVFIWSPISKLCVCVSVSVCVSACPIINVKTAIL
jgi:hypothetical protein